MARYAVLAVLSRFAYDTAPANRLSDAMSDMRAARDTFAMLRIIHASSRER